MSEEHGIYDFTWIVDSGRGPLFLARLNDEFDKIHPDRAGHLTFLDCHSTPGKGHTTQHTFRLFYVPNPRQFAADVAGRPNGGVSVGNIVEVDSRDAYGLFDVKPPEPGGAVPREAQFCRELIETFDRYEDVVKISAELTQLRLLLQMSLETFE